MNSSPRIGMMLMVGFSATLLAKVSVRGGVPLLKAAVEGMAACGKGQPRASKESVNVEEGNPVSIPTVTKTGMETGEKVSESA